MKKILTSLFLTLVIILISGCSLNEQKSVDNSAINKQITALQQQMSSFSSQIETLKSENEQLKKENQKLIIQKNAKTETSDSEILSNQNKSQFINEIGDWKTYEDKNTQDPHVVGIKFSIKYPSSWTYQKFSCNIDGVAFCPLKGNSPSNCGQTCGMDSPISPIYLYPFRGEPIIPESKDIKYWKEPNIKLDLTNEKHRDIYTKMIDTFEFIK